MARRTSQPMKAALDAHRGTVANEKALTYAPWVLLSLLAVHLKDKMPAMEVSEWTRYGAFALVLVVLARYGQRALMRQRERIERRISSLLATRTGFRELSQLQARSPRYRAMKFSFTLQQQMLQAAMSRQNEDDEVRERRRRQRATANAA